MLHLQVSCSHTYIQHNQHTSLYAFGLLLMFRSVTKTTRATAERDIEVPTVRDAHHAS